MREARRRIRQVLSDPPELLDGTSILTVYVILLFCVPAGLHIGPLGAAGSPAQVLGLVMLCWWLAAFLARTWPQPTYRQPLNWAMSFFLVTICVSYVAAMTRPLDGVEMLSADRGLLSGLAWMGVFLTAATGLASRERLDLLLRRVTYGVGLVAVVGIAQFLTGQTIVDRIQIPGLSAGNNIISVLSRGGLTRPPGTALHPIEFGVVLSMGLALALHCALEQGGAEGMRRWLPVGAIIAAIPLSISRSATVGLVIVVVLLLPTWSRERRHNAYWLGAIGLVAFGAMVPSLFRTLASLFTGISGDSSVGSRTGSYDIAGEFILRTPLFGRGISTFLPEYRILDNQYLLTTIEMGVVGVLALITLFLTGVLTGEQIRREAPHSGTRQLGRALTATLCVAGVSFALFDALSFSMAAGFVFLVLGLTSSARMLQQQDRALSVQSEVSATERSAMSRLPNGQGRRGPFIGHDAPR